MLVLLAALILLTIAIIHSDNRMTAAIAMTIFATGAAACVVLIASHNRPFTGEISVGPEVLLQVMPKDNCASLCDRAADVVMIGECASSHRRRPLTRRPSPAICVSALNQAVTSPDTRCAARRRAASPNALYSAADSSCFSGCHSACHCTPTMNCFSSS